MTAPSGTALELLTVGRICVDLYANETRRQLHRSADVHQVDRWIGHQRGHRCGATRPPCRGVHQGRRRPVRCVRAPQARPVRRRHALRRHAPVHAHAARVRGDGPAGGPDAADVPVPDGSRSDARDLGDRSRRSVADVPILWLTGAWFSKDPARATCWELLAIRQRRKAHVVFDLDYRANFWPSRRRRPAPTSAPSSTTSPSQSATGSSARWLSAPSDPPEAARRMLDRGVRVGDRQDGRQWCDGGRRRRQRRWCRRTSSRSCAASVPATPSVACWPTVCCPVGSRCASSSTATSPGRSSPAGCCAPTPCQRSTEVRRGAGGSSCCWMTTTSPR